MLLISFDIVISLFMEVYEFCVASSLVLITWKEIVLIYPEEYNFRIILILLLNTRLFRGYRDTNISFRFVYYLASHNLELMQLAIV